jgi:hypothetical protein
MARAAAGADDTEGYEAAPSARVARAFDGAKDRGPKPFERQWPACVRVLRVVDGGFAAGTPPHNLCLIGGS